MPPDTAPTGPRLCEHENFQADVEVNRLTSEEGGSVTGYSADLRIWCADCDEAFRFTGVHAGLLPSQPMCSVDEKELHIPIRPASADPDFGLGWPGFSIQQVVEPHD
jgi:hypothetical protein